MLVGREAELNELSRALDDSLAGRGRLYLVYGEPGIGKTRLCDELAARAATQGVPLFWGRCWEAGGAPAYWPWLDVLPALCNKLDASALDQSLGEGRAALAAIVPALRSKASAAADHPQHARLQLFRAVSGLLRTVASERGLVLVLEDLHAADEASLLLLHFVARELRGMRALVLVTFRDVEARLSAAVGEALGRLTREGTSLSLARLSLESAEALLRERCRTLDQEAVQLLFRRTQGNPLFLQELAGLFRQQTAEPPNELPASVRDVLRERLSRVPPAARRWLDAAAVGGDDIDPALLAAALEQPLPTVVAELVMAEQAGVIVRQKQGFGFFHALVREVLDNDLSDTARADLHARLARALEARHASRDELPYGELAHHWLLAGPGALPRMLECAVRAAEQALGRFGFEDAIAILERARSAIELADADWRLRAEVLLALGQAQIRRGAGALGQALCVESANLARDQHDATLLARAALAYGLEITAALINPVLIALLQEALQALPETDATLRVQVMARLAAAMQPHPDLMYPIGLAREAIAAARRIGDAPTLLYALHTGMSAMMDIVDPHERVPLNVETEQLADALGDHERVLRSLVRLTFDHMELGELNTADVHIARFERMTRERRAARYAWRVPLFHSMRAQMHGRFAQAEDLLEQAHELGTLAEDPQLSRCYAFHREGLLRAWERHAEMVAFDLSVRPLRAAFYSGRHWQNGGSAFTHARMEAVERTRMYLSMIPQDDWPLVHNPPAFFHLGEPLALCGEPAAVRQVYELLLPSAAYCVSWGFTKFLWDGPAVRVLALLATRLEHYDEARSHFEAALERSQRLDVQPYLARTRYEYGRSLLALGRALDHDSALRMIDRARADAQALDMRGLVELAEQQLGGAALPLRPTRELSVVPLAAAADPAVETGPSLPFGFLLQPEGEFWTIQHAAGSFKLRDSLGLGYLSRLFAEPDRPIHVLELSSGDAGALAPALRSDAGELLDERARHSYRQRAQELEDELAEAEQFHDAARSEKARNELEFLGAELSRAVGLGGRTRRAGSASERARSAVQRRIRNVLERVRKLAPELAELWERSITTGTYCVFRPGPEPRERIVP